MATTTTVKSGLGRKAYNEAVKAAQNARDLASYTETLASYTTQHDSALALLRDLRQVYVDHFGAYGIDYLQSNISEQEYRVSSLKQNMNSTQQKIDRINGNTVVVEDDDE